MAAIYVANIRRDGRETHICYACLLQDAIAPHMLYADEYWPLDTLAPLCQYCGLPVNGETAWNAFVRKRDEVERQTAAFQARQRERAEDERKESPPLSERLPLLRRNILNTETVHIRLLLMFVQDRNRTSPPGGDYP